MSLMTAFPKTALVTALLGMVASQAQAATPSNTWSITLDPDHPMAQETDNDVYYASNSAYDASAYTTVLDNNQTGKEGIFLVTRTASAGDVTVTLGYSTTATRVNAASWSNAIVSKQFSLYYQVEGQTTWTEILAPSSSSGTLPALTLPSGYTTIRAKVVPHNDRVVTGARTVSLYVVTGGTPGGSSATSMVVADDDVRAKLRPQVPVVSESSGKVGAFRVDFTTTQQNSAGTPGVLGLGASTAIPGLSLDSTMEFTVHLDQMTTAPSGERLDATPGTTSSADYLLMWMPAHNSNSATITSTGKTTADYGSESMLTFGTTKRIHDWTKGWTVLRDASKGENVVYLSPGPLGSFLPLDYFYPAWGSDPIQVENVEYGYLVTVTYLGLTNLLSWDFIDFDGNVQSDLGLTFATEPGKSYITNSYVITISSTPRYAVTLGWGLADDISADTEVFNYGCFTKANGDLDIVTLGTAGYYGMEIGYLPLTAVLGEPNTTVSGAKAVRVSMTDSTDYVVDAPGVANGLIADDDSYSSWTSVSNAAVDPTASPVSVTGGNAILTWSAPLPIDAEISLSIDTGSSTAGESTDFVAIPKSWRLPAGTTSLSVPVTPIYDASRWPAGTDSRIVRLRLQSSYDFVNDAHNGTWGSSVDVAITRKAGTVTIAADAATIAESTSALSTGTFTVTLDRGATGSTRAVAIAYKITGTAKESSDFTSLSGVVTILEGSETAQIPISVLPDSVAEGDETVAITLVESDGYSLGNTTTATMTIVDAAPKVSVDASSADVIEGNSVTLTFSYQGDQRSAFSLPYTVGGTATKGDDYSIGGEAGQVTFPSDSKQVTVTLTTVEDGTEAPDETVTITIASGDFYTVVTQKSVATMTIKPRSHGEVTVVPLAGSSTVTEGGTGGFVISVNRASANIPAGDVVVTYALSGNATAIADYTAPALTATIPAAETSVSVSLVTTADNLGEGNEEVTLTLDGGNDYVLGTPKVATVTIVDVAPVISVPDASVVASVSEGGSISLTVASNRAATAGFAVSYSIGDSSTAKEGTDYAVSALNFVAGATTATLDITAPTDGVVDGDKTLVITLTADSSSAAYVLGTSTTMTVTIKDVDTNAPGENQPPAGAGGGSTSSGCGLGSGVAGILLGMFLLMRLRLRSDKRSRAA